MISIVRSPEIPEVSSPEKDGPSPPPATPVVGRMKAPPVCLDSSLKETAMTTEELSKSTFSTEVTVPRTAFYNNAVVTTTDTPIPVSSSSSICTRDSDSDGEKHDSSPTDRINAVVSLRKTSRQGRATQRWITTADETIRLTTGCVPILRGGKILLVSASRKAEWILPKGGWELDETMEESAVRECFEEAGVLGVLGPKLADIQYETRKAKKRRLQLELEQKEKRTKLDTDDDVSTKDPSGNSNTAVLSSISKVLEQSEAGTLKVPEETSSVASAASATYNQVRMTLFPLYVSSVADVWPESGRFRKAVDIDEAIEMLDSRPEFKKALLDVKERGLHLISEPQPRPTL